MAPWLQLRDAAAAVLDWEVYESSYSELETRASKNDNMYRLKEEQKYALHIVVVTVSAVSLAAGLVASHWFYRMRRSFRHE